MLSLLNLFILQTHLDSLYDTLLEQNLLRIIEPFSRVQVQHVSNLINLPLVCMTNQLIQTKFDGMLDEGVAW